MMGVQNLQGYYFSRPQNHVDCNTYIVNSTNDQPNIFIKLQEKAI